MTEKKVLEIGTGKYPFFKTEENDSVAQRIGMDISFKALTEARKKILRINKQTNSRKLIKNQTNKRKYRLKISKKYIYQS
jgi:hypothetical protein